MISSSGKSCVGTLCAVTLILCSGQLLAVEAIELDELVVTSGLQPVPAEDIASSITIITRAEIEQKQARFLSDLLRDVPGFAVSQAGGVGSQTQVRVRGAEANQLLVLMDGVRANDRAGSDEFPYQLALTSNIERIEIIRGPQSATWGSDAMAGVINIIRTKAAGGRYLSGGAEAGSFSTMDAYAEGGYSSEVVQLSAGLSHFETDGTNLSRSGNEKDGADNTSGNVELKFDAGDALSLRLSGQVIDARNDFDDIDYFVTGLPIDADLVTESGQAYLSGELLFNPLHSPFSGSLSVNRMNSDNDNFSDGGWTGSTAAATLEFRLRGSTVFGAQQNNRIGFALESEDVEFSQRGEATMYGDPNQDQEYTASGYALEYAGKPFAGFSWTVSGRHDHYSDFDDASTWRLAAVYQWSASVRLRGSVGTGSKVPTFTERFGFFDDYFKGNPDLRPESSKGWEIGIDTRWSQNTQQLEVVYFDQDLQDEIDGFVFDPLTFMFTALNKDTDSQRKGVEAAWDAYVGKAFKVGATYTYTDAREKDPTRQTLPEVRRPKHMASFFANRYFANNRGNLNLNINFSGTQQDIFFSPHTYVSELVELDAYTVVDLAAAWKLTPSVELTARISNLLDEHYEEILGFVRPGRAVYAGLRGSFDF